jgi:hypothetical protein
LGLKAGDLIDVTNTTYAYTAKVFRITKIAEEDVDDGSIQLSITALEYSASVYDQTNLVYTARTTATGIVPKSSNTAVSALDASQYGNTPTVKAFVTDPIFITNDGTQSGTYAFDPSLTDQQFYDADSLEFVCAVDGSAQSVTLKYSGYYFLTYNANFGGTGATVINDWPATIRKQMRIRLYKNGELQNLGQQQVTTIPKGDDPWADLVCLGKFQAVAGDVITFKVGLKSDMKTTTSPPVLSAVWIIGELKFLGTTA